MHDGLVGLVLEVALPTRPEFREWPAVDPPEFLLGGTNLDTGVDTVGRHGTGAVEVPFTLSDSHVNVRAL